MRIDGKYQENSFLTKDVQNGNQSKDKSKESVSGMLYGGNLNLAADPVEKKRKEAQAMAMQLIKNAFSSDSEIDKEVESRTEHRTELMEANKEQSQMLADIAEEKKGLMELYDKDSEEYKSRMQELNQNAKEIQKTITDNESAIHEDDAVVRGIAIERLKTHDMVDAQKQSDKIMSAANDEIIGMLMEEVKETQDTKLESEKEEAAEKKQEEAEQEAKIEAAKAEKEQQEENDHDEMYELGNLLDQVKKQSSGATAEDVKKSLTLIVNELKLTTEDLKGAAVDEEV